MVAIVKKMLLKVMKSSKGKADGKVITALLQAKRVRDI